MKPMVYCKPTSKGIHSFYLKSEGEEYFLFCQDYRAGVQDYFSRGVSLDDAYNYSKANHNSALIKTISKLPMYIRYVEKEYGIEVLEQTKKHKRQQSGKFSRRCA